MAFVSIGSSAVQECHCGCFAQIDDDKLVAGPVSQLTVCTPRDTAFCWYATRSKKTKESARKCDGVEKQRRVLDLCNQPVAEIFCRTSTSLL